jgi:acetolactate synthase-1/2/3 large subunit
MEDVTGACLVDIKGALSFDEIPKCISYVDNVTRQRASALLENPYPFLDNEEMEKIDSFMLND